MNYCINNIVFTKCFIENKTNSVIECYIKPEIFWSSSDYIIFVDKNLLSYLSNNLSKQNNDHLNGIILDCLAWKKVKVIDKYSLKNIDDISDYILFSENIWNDIDNFILLLPSEKIIEKTIIDCKINKYTKVYPYYLWNQANLELFRYNNDEFSFFIYKYIKETLIRKFEKKNEVINLYKDDFLTSKMETDITRNVLKPIFVELKDKFNISISSETQATNWNVDFYFSVNNFSGNLMQVCIEVKLSTNASYWVLQLKEYIDQIITKETANSNKWIILLLNFDISNDNLFYENEIDKCIKKLDKNIYDIKRIVINCRKRPKPSSLKD